MGAVWRRWAVSLGLLAGLLAGCHHDSPRRAAPPTTGPAGGPGATTSTAPAAPTRFLAASFAGDQEGWGLSKEPCPRPGADQAQCAAVWRTADGGDGWASLAQLDVPTAGAAGTDYVSAIHVADATHGWVYDRNLFATFSGGKRWQPVDLGNPVVALDSLGSMAYALVGSCAVGAGNCAAPMRLFEGTIATGRWRFVTLGFDLPPTDAGAVVVSRSAVYAVVSGGGPEQILLARVANGRWERRTVPCPRALVAAIQSQDGLVAACMPASIDGRTELQTSSDGGRSWAVVWQQSFPGPVVSLAVTPDAAVVGLENGAVLRSVDNGMHFSAVLQTGGRPDIRFSDVQHGFITAGPASGRRLFSTKDGGATWRALNLPN
jgi:hypothetical protein